MNHPVLCIGSELTREELAELVARHLGLDVDHFGSARVPHSMLSGLPVLEDGIAPGVLRLYDPAVVVDGEEMLNVYPETPLAATGYEIHCRVAGEREEQEALVLGFFEKLKELGMPMLVFDEADRVLGEYDP